MGLVEIIVACVLFVSNVETKQLYSFLPYTHKVVATVYNPCPEQCNIDYTVTADMSKIDMRNINKLRWVALSRDLLERWGGAFGYGDTVVVVAGDARVDGYWVVHDCMAERWEARIDFLQDSVHKGGVLGLWDGVIIYRKDMCWINKIRTYIGL